MRALKIFSDAISRALFAGVLLALVSGFTGCSMTRPLATELLREEAKDPQFSIVLLRFKSPHMTPDKDFLGLADRNGIYWTFAVANESTGWNFRKLDPFSMVFRTRDDAMEPATSDAESGWVTFLVPSGLSYISVMNFTIAGGGNQNRPATPFPDHISVGYAGDQPAAQMMDFTDTPRFAVQVSDPQSLIYAGTIVRTNKCGAGQNSTACAYNLTVTDESELAKKFIGRYPDGFSGAAPMRTQLLDIPQTRTIEIRGGSVTPARVVVRTFGPLL